jgi:spore coat polysaccharide biosynthesis protein SpsF
MKIVVVVQARTGSTRLPGKILRPLAGRPVLERQLERISAARGPFELVVATTIDPADDAVVDLCRRVGVRCFRGHPTDLLDRHLWAARELGADEVVKIPSDCPLIDPRVIDQVLAAFDPARHDYCGNLHPGSWPDGNDVEIMPMAALERAHREAQKPFEREHTTPYLWNHPDRFRLHNVVWKRGVDLSESHRFTIDYEEDYRFIAAVYDALYDARRAFSVDDILRLLEERPDIYALNAAHRGVFWYRHHQDELKHA